MDLTTFTQYKGDFPFAQVYPPQIMNNGISEWVSKKGLKQYHCAETEKYAHVTFFFNGGTEKQFEGEGARAPPPPSSSPQLRDRCTTAAAGRTIAALRTPAC